MFVRRLMKKTGFVYQIDTSSFTPLMIIVMWLHHVQVHGHFRLILPNFNKSAFSLDNAIVENLSIGCGKSDMPTYGDSVSCSSVLGSFGVVLNDRFSSIVSALRSELESVLNPRPEWYCPAAENEIRSRFKGNTKFIIEQAVSELENPILIDMRNVLCGKLGVICRSVHSEFMELVSTIGGPMEKKRATQLLRRLLVVDDCPWERMVELPTTRKIAMKNKIIFVAGDHGGAPTLTANMGFL